MKRISGTKLKNNKYFNFFMFLHIYLIVTKTDRPLDCIIAVVIIIIINFVIVILSAPDALETSLILLAVAGDVSLLVCS